MVIVVTVVSTMVHVYSIGYMSHDPHNPRFFAYLSLFTFAMLMLVTADNLVQMFMGWEGVGLASYLLIGFWYHKPEANAAAIKAFLVNRVGDFGFALGIFGTYLLFDTVVLDEIFPAVQEGRVGDHFPLVQRRCADRADHVAVHRRHGQVGAAWAAHLAAGRDGGTDPGLRPDPRRDHGDGRCVHGGAAVADDGIRADTLDGSDHCRRLDRVLRGNGRALSERHQAGHRLFDLLQLGYMFFACGVSAYSAGIFHLLTHAFFKALLFLGAGSVIHAMSDEQDMRNMGGLRTRIPLTFWLMVIGTLALTGFPFLAGYYSKDLIFESAFAAPYWGGKLRLLDWHHRRRHDCLL